MQSVDEGTTLVVGDATRRRSDLAETSEDVLLSLVQQRDTAAFAELYLRHYSDALRYAQRLTRRHLDRDRGDDILSEAVRRMLSALERGRGPAIGFRQYLFTAVRSVTFEERSNLHREEIRAELPDEEFPAPDEGLDGVLAMAAFASLPERWRQVLWSSKVREMAPREIAPLMGVRAHNVAMMAIRARDALRIAYVRAHLPNTANQTCQDAAGVLARRAVAPVAVGQTRLLAEHLAVCEECREVEASLDREIDSWSWAIGTAAVVEILPLDEPAPAEVSEDVA